MKRLGIYALVMVAAMVSACQPAAETTPQTAGKVFMGDFEGAPLKMATGFDLDVFMEMHAAFNNRDVDALWEHVADSLKMNFADGNVETLSKEDMAGFLSSMTEVSWDLYAVIPVQVKGSENVNVLVDGREAVTLSDGTSWDYDLFERFVYEDGKLVTVYQWTKERLGE